MNRPRPLRVLALALGVALGLGAVAPAAHADAPSVVADVQTGTLSGVLTLAGTPVTAGTVQAQAEGASTIQHAAVGADGRYTLADLAPGRYLVSAYPADDSTWLQTFAPSAGRAPDARLVEVTAGAVADASIALKHGATVTGVVRDTAGRPVSGAWVYGTNLTRTGFSTARTDANGRYTIRRLATGKAAVEAWSGRRTASTTVQAVRGASVTAHTLVVRNRDGRVSGTVTLADGRLTSAHVTLLDSHKRWVARVTPTSSGSYSFRNVAAGTYWVALDGANVARKVTVTASRTTKVAVLHRGKRSTVSGVLRSPGGARVAKETVTLRDAFGSPAGHATTDARGRYSIRGVVKGYYTLHAERDRPGALATVTKRFTARSGTPVRADLRLVKAATVRGVVRDGAGRPVEGVFVWTSNIDTTDGEPAVTDAAGRFVLTGVYPGERRVWTNDPYAAGYRDASVPFTARAGRTASVTVTVR